ncbi:IS1 family transposase [Desulfotalea psychrophila]|uniref:IS1 family transposase n=1 Tax=Desulfotalea psychrophila TaxID=84980 RepID=UPI000A0740D1
MERQNLNLRTRLKRLNRKTIGFSKSTGLHVIADRERILLNNNLATRPKILSSNFLYMT